MAKPLIAVIVGSNRRESSALMAVPRRAPGRRHRGGDAAYSAKAACCPVERSYLIDKDRPSCRKAVGQNDLCRPRPLVGSDRANNGRIVSPVKLTIGQHDGGPDAALLASACRPQVDPHEIARLEQK